MNDNKEENISDKIKGKFKKKAFIFFFSILFMFILMTVVLYFLLNPLATLRAAISGDPSDMENINENVNGEGNQFGWSRFWKTGGLCFFDSTCIDDEGDYVQQKIYNKAKNSVDKLKELDKVHGVNAEEINPFLAVSTAFTGNDYNSDDDTYIDENGKETVESQTEYLNEALKMVGIVLDTPGEGLTKKVYYCINADDETDTYVMCGSGEKETECETTCTKETKEKGTENHYKTYPNIEPRNDDEYKHWLIESGELEQHLIRYGVQLPDDSTEEKENLLNNEADIVILRKDYYEEIYNEENTQQQLTRAEVDEILQNVTYTKGSYKYPLVKLWQCDFGSEMCSYGCGPTSAAVLLNTMLQSTSYSPVELRQDFSNNGLTAHGGGTTWGMSAYLGKTYGIDVSGPYGASDAQTMVDALSTGNSLVIASVTGSMFYRGGGHYIVIYGVTEEGKLMVFDEGHKDTNVGDAGVMVVDASEVLGYLNGGFWIFTN